MNLSIVGHLAVHSGACVARHTQRPHGTVFHAPRSFYPRAQIFPPHTVVAVAVAARPQEDS